MAFKMKIIKQYWDDIIKKRKFLEFRRVDFLESKEDFTSDSFFIGNGRIKLTVSDNIKDITLGNIYFNGFRIINKIKFFNYLESDNYYILMMNYGLSYDMKSWILENISYLKEYYKHEKEILILFIEKAVSYER